MDVISKIRKLLALARDAGATEAEAATAMSMASKLMLEHNITDVGEEAVKNNVIIGEWTRPDFAPWSVWIGMAVGKLYHTRHITVFARGCKVHKWAGMDVNVEACSLTMYFLCEQVEALYKRELKSYNGRLSRGGRAELRQTFKEACARRVFQRAGEIAAANRGDIPDHRALVVVDRSLEVASEMMKAAGMKHKDVAIKRVGIGTVAGHIAGNEVRIQQEVR